MKAGATIVVVVALLSAAIHAGQTARVIALKKEIAEEREKAAEIRAEGFQAGLEQAAENSRNLLLVNDSIFKALNDEREKSSAALAAGTAHADTARRLQQYANRLAANCARKPESATAPSSSPSASAPGMVLAELSTGLDERGSAFARFAEQALIAAETCTAYADSLEPLR